MSSWWLTDKISPKTLAFGAVAVLSGAALLIWLRPGKRIQSAAQLQADLMHDEAILCLPMPPKEETQESSDGKSEQSQQKLVHVNMLYSRLFEPEVPEMKKNEWNRKFRDWLNTLPQKLAKDGGGDLASLPVIVFIHGFDNAADDVRQRSDNFDSNLGHTQVVVVPYDWESAESMLKYTKDKRTASHHAKKIGEYFEALLHEMQDKSMTKLCIICHSMGNYLLFRYLSDVYLRSDKYMFSQLTHCEVIAVAADCEKIEYGELVNKMMSDQTYGITKWSHYYNEKDTALWFSKAFENHWAKGAAGKQAIENQHGHQSVMSIDCCNYTDKERKWWNPRTWFSTGHSYIDRKEVIKDIKQAIDGTHISKRRLKQVNDAGRVYKLK